LTPDTSKFTFELPNKAPLLLPIGQHVLVSADVKNEGMIVRPYTPVVPSFPEEDTGAIELVVKMYKGGKMSTHLSQMKLGETLKIKGPAGPVLYHGNG
jgi:NAD(P)H-flavin reductase